MTEHENPYQPPPGFEEDSVIFTEHVPSGLYVTVLMLLFAVSIIAFRSVSADLGVGIRSLGLLLFTAFTWYLMKSLWKMFEKI